MNNCPCNSGNEFKECCEPLLNGDKVAKTAEELMRSRYSAYAKENIEYIDKTHHPDHGKDFDKDEALKWAQESSWEGLEIVRTDKGKVGDEKGIVEFKAFYVNQSQKCTHHEIAQFSKHEDHWFYTEGTIVGAQPIKRTEPKLGRNDPCSCGSGKKFKKCCM